MGDYGSILLDCLYWLDNLDSIGWIVSLSFLGCLGESGFYELASLLLT